MTLLHPWLVLLPVVVGGLYLWPLKRPRRETIYYPSTELLAGIPKSLRQRLRAPVLTTLAALCLLCLSMAAARPQTVVPLPDIVAGRNLMLALDVSRSMRLRDFPTMLGNVERLQAIISVVTDFIRARTKDRIGLVVFGTNAFLQSPLTLDHELLITLVSELAQVDAGPATAIGDGLGLSVKRISALPAKSRAIVLLTDGVSNAGHVSAVKAARVAAELGIVVHTIGIGPDTRGSGAEFDESTLKSIAALTKGRYFRASSLQDLRKVYAEIDLLETEQHKDAARKVAEEGYGKWALSACAFYVLFVFLRFTYFEVFP